MYILKSCTITEATINRNLYTPQTTARLNESYRVEFKYIVNSNEYIQHEDLGDKIKKYNVGNKIKIYYNNSDVTKAQVYRVSYFPILFALLLLLMSTLAIIKSEKRKI